MAGSVMEACYCMVVAIIFTEIRPSLQDALDDRIDLRSRMDLLHLGKRTQDRLVTMLRAGRQVPMPRIGRRASPSISGRLSTEQLAAALAAILDEPRDRSGARRQPPLPRYGRDTDSATSDILDLLSSNADNPYLDLLSNSISNNNNNAATYFRPAPRGGRYKRSSEGPDMAPARSSKKVNPTKSQEGFKAVTKADQDFWGTGAFDRSFRAVPFARFGRPADFERLAKAKKASPFPRIGRNRIEEARQAL